MSGGAETEPSFSGDAVECWLCLFPILSKQQQNQENKKKCILIWGAKGRRPYFIDRTHSNVNLLSRKQRLLELSYTFEVTLKSPRSDHPLPIRFNFIHNSLQLIFSTSFQFIHCPCVAWEAAAAACLVSSSCSQTKLVTICLLSSNVALPHAFQLSPNPNPALLLPQAFHLTTQRSSAVFWRGRIVYHFTPWTWTDDKCKKQTSWQAPGTNQCSCHRCLIHLGYSEDCLSLAAEVSYTRWR